MNLGGPPNSHYNQESLQQVAHWMPSIGYHCARYTGSLQEEHETDLCHQEFRKQDSDRTDREPKKITLFLNTLHFCIFVFLRDFPIAQKVKNLPAIQETHVLSLGWEYPLEKGMATHSGFLIWRIPWTEEPGGLQSMGSQS